MMTSQMKSVCVFLARSYWRGELCLSHVVGVTDVCGCRRLFQFGSSENNKFVALYEKMTQTMEETERLKPDFLEVAKVVW